MSLVAVSCGSDTTTSDRDTPTATPPLEVSDESCAAYLTFLGARDGIALNAALADLFATVDDADLTSAILTVRDGTGPIGEVTAASDLLSAKLVPACEPIYSSDVSPTATNQEAAQVFIDALNEGDRDAAGAVAWANVVAQFDPWEPLPDGMTPLSFEIETDLLTFDIEQGIEVDCLLGQGQIILCEFE